ncbi:hypothetical protein ACWDBW_10655 [Streptomyces sp. NPDC001107]
MTASPARPPVFRRRAHPPELPRRATPAPPAPAATAAAGLLHFDEARLRFRHPLVRSAVVQSEPSIRRLAANAALADVLGDDPYRRTLHRAQSIVGPDDQVADEREPGVR